MLCVTHVTDSLLVGSGDGGTTCGCPQHRSQGEPRECLARGAAGLGRSASSMTGRGGTTERNGSATPLSRAIALVLGCLTMSCSGGGGGSGDLEGGLNGGDGSGSEQENPGDAHG